MGSVSCRGLRIALAGPDRLSKISKKLRDDMFYLFMNLSFLIPLTAGCLLAAVGSGWPDRRIAFYVNTVCAGTLLFVLLTFAGGDFTVTLLKITDRITLSLRSDGLSRLFLSAAVIVWLAVALYAGRDESTAENKVRFFSFYLIVFGMFVPMVFSSGLFTMLLFFDLMILTSFPLVFHGMSVRYAKNGIGNLIYAAVCLCCVLFGIVFFFRYGSPAAFITDGTPAAMIPAGAGNPVLAASFLSVAGFALTSVMFPLLLKRNAENKTDFTPASAVLSGVIAFSGLFCAVRVVYFTVGTAFLRGTWVQTAWIIAALAGVAAGSASAFGEKNLKKSLAYWTVSRISCAFLGLVLMNGSALTGALLQALSGPVMISGLFLTAGAMDGDKGFRYNFDFRGAARSMPRTILCFTILSFAFIGFPPLAGFMGKWYLALGALDSGFGALYWVVPAVLLLSMLLTAGYLLQIILPAYFPGNDFDPKTLPGREDPSGAVLFPILTLTFLSVILGLNASLVIDAVKSLAL